MSSREATETDSERRSFPMAGALASTAFVLGGGGVASATEGVAAGQDAEAQQPQEGLVFAYDYWPLTPFTVTNQLQTTTTVDILNGIDDEGIAEISQPDVFNGYVVNYTPTDDGPGTFTLVFTAGTLQRDGQYQFEDDGQMFSTDLNLPESTLTSQGSGDS
jgi:hypothetical protein